MTRWGKAILFITPFGDLDGSKIPAMLPWSSDDVDAFLEKLRSPHSLAVPPLWMHPNDLGSHVGAKVVAGCGRLPVGRWI